MDPRPPMRLSRKCPSARAGRQRSWDFPRATQLLGYRRDPTADRVPTDHRGQESMGTRRETLATIHGRRAMAQENPWCTIFLPRRRVVVAVNISQHCIEWDAALHVLSWDRFAARPLHRQHLPQPDGRGSLFATSGAGRPRAKRRVAGPGSANWTAATCVRRANMCLARHAPERREALRTGAGRRNSRRQADFGNGKRPQARCVVSFPNGRRQDVPAWALGRPGDCRSHRAGP